MRFPGRARGLPRQRPAPELNNVQNPELLRALQQVLGIRQAHINPAIADTLQPVVIAADSTKGPTARPMSYGVQATMIGDGTHIPNVELRNPAGSGTVAVIRSMHCQVVDPTVPNPNLLAFTVGQEQILGFGAGGGRGFRLAVGSVPTGVSGLGDALQAPSLSALRWFQVQGLAGAYFWQGPLVDGTYFFWEGHGDRGGLPPIQLYPGGSLYVEFLDASLSQMYINTMWDEYPLT